MKPINSWSNHYLSGKFAGLDLQFACIASGGRPNCLELWNWQHPIHPVSAVSKLRTCDQPIRLRVLSIVRHSTDFDSRTPYIFNNNEQNFDNNKLKFGTDITVIYYNKNLKFHKDILLIFE